MEFLSDPAIWIGLFTLIVLEIILGIDNLVFIAILADKLPPHQRDRARQIGLGLALIMRLGLLTVVSWLVTLTTPLFSVGPWGFSGRDLILIIGGLFLVFKATMELHERLEGTIAKTGPNRAYAAFWVVVSQIVVIDAVFSLDAVITAVGMVEELGVMYAAVIISMGVMLMASKPLTRFVSAHPTVVVLCLSFLLMIGFSLIAEGFGVKVPKGYLYAAIGFSVMIETINQFMQRNRVRNERREPLRERTADAILRLMGRPDEDGTVAAGSTTENSQGVSEAAFRAEERQMISGVLTLAERSIRRIMTPRSDISWVDCRADADTVRQLMLQTPHSIFPICRGSLDQVLGVMRAKDLFTVLSEGRDLAQAAAAHPPILVPEQIDVIKLLGVLRQARGSLVLVTDEYGVVQGLVTPHDVLEAIAGEFPDSDETPDIVSDGEGWLVKGGTDLFEFERVIGDLALDGAEEQYHTLAGLLLAQHEQFPAVGERFQFGNFVLTVSEVAQHRIERVRVASAPVQVPGG